MADALAEEGLWEGRGVRTSDVLDAMEALRHRLDVGAVRTSVLTLVVLTDGDIDTMRDAVHRLGGRHPSRTVIVRRSPGGTGLDARVGVHALRRNERLLGLDDVVLDVHGTVGRHLDLVVEPLALPDLPAVVWHHGGLPPPDEPLLGWADLTIIDSAVGGAGSLESVVELCAHATLADLAWSRLVPLRQRLTGLLRAPTFLPFLEGVVGAEVTGPEPARALLAGWLHDRLGLPPARLHIAAHKVVRVVLHCEPDGREARFEVSDDGSCLRAQVAVSGGPSTETSLGRPPDDDVAAVGRVLLRPRADPVYEAALRASVGLGA